MSQPKEKKKRKLSWPSSIFVHNRITLRCKVKITLSGNEQNERKNCQRKANRVLRSYGCGNMLDSKVKFIVVYLLVIQMKYNFGFCSFQFTVFRKRLLAPTSVALHVMANLMLFSVCCLLYTLYFMVGVVHAIAHRHFTTHNLIRTSAFSLVHYFHCCVTFLFTLEYP